MEGIVVKPLAQHYLFGYPKKGDMGWLKWKREFGESWEVDAVRPAPQRTPLPPFVFLTKLKV